LPNHCLGHIWLLEASLESSRPSDPRAEKIVRSFVRVVRKTRLGLDRNTSPDKTGYGLVVDASHGLVLISRAIIPHSLCEVTITIANSIITDGKVIFLYPTSNYAIMRYDPQLVNAPVEVSLRITSFTTPIYLASLQMCPEPLGLL
jgi:pro-apoptotic serine protease NMA111